MANNCLQTKLKAEVQNDNLIKISELVFDAKKTIVKDASKQQRLRIAATEPFTVRIIGSGYLATSLAALPTSTQQSINVAAGSVQELFFTNDNYTIAVSNKDKISNILFDITPSLQSVLNIDLSRFYSCTSLKELQLSQNCCKGDISSLELCPFAILQMDIPNIVGNVSVLSDKQIIQLNLGNTGVSGNLTSISAISTINQNNINFVNTLLTGSLAELAKLRIGNKINIAGCANITGDIKEFAEYLWNIRQLRSGNRIVQADGTSGATFFTDESLTYVTLAFDSTGVTVSQSESSVKKKYNGSTWSNVE